MPNVAQMASQSSLVPFRKEIITYQLRAIISFALMTRDWNKPTECSQHEVDREGRIFYYRLNLVPSITHTNPEVILLASGFWSSNHKIIATTTVDGVPCPARHQLPPPIGAMSTFSTTLSLESMSDRRIMKARSEDAFAEVHDAGTRGKDRGVVIWRRGGYREANGCTGLTQGLAKPFCIPKMKADQSSESMCMRSRTGATENQRKAVSITTTSPP